MSHACAMLVALSSVSLTGDPQPSSYSRDAAQNLAALREYVDINAVNATDGSLILLDQVRSIEAIAISLEEDATNRVDAPDFEPWLESVHAAVRDLGFTTTASASQNSVIQANSITAAGSSSIGVSQMTMNATSHSTLDVIFAVLEPVEVSITGVIGARGCEICDDAPTGVLARAFVSLSNNVTGTVFSQFISAARDFTKEPVSYSGPIDAGVYTFHVIVDSTGAFQDDTSAEASFVVDFSVVAQGPQSSDLDADGDVDLFDYSKFHLEFSGPK